MACPLGNHGHPSLDNEHQHAPSYRPAYGCQVACLKDRLGKASMLQAGTIFCILTVRSGHEEE